MACFMDAPLAADDHRAGLDQGEDYYGVQDQDPARLGVYLKCPAVKGDGQLRIGQGHGERSHGVTPGQE